MFMVLMAMLQMFGNVSIYTNETFLLTRTWQGKSFAANFIIPAVLWLFLRIGEQKRENVFWALLAILLWTAGLASALVVFLAMLLSGVFALYLAIQRKKIQVLLKAAAACVPGGAYVLLYIIL
jgi:ABC-type antimicrobial peptide transport system permease subunit